MGYCENPWISDYTYEAVMSYRRANSAVAGVAALAQPCLLVWGRIIDGQAVLEPAFQIVTRPRMPARRGAYSLEASGSDGSRMFTLSFDPIPTADDPRGSRHFAFAVPLDQFGAARLGNLRLTGPGIRVASLSRSAVRLQRAVRPDEVVLRREGEAVKLEWDAAAHPMIMVRDPETGDVLSFARGGHARVWTQKAELELQVSDGVQSQGVRRAISR